MITLVLGGARSGKSRYAETLIEEGLRGTLGGEKPKKAIYIATAQALDEEMSDRIAHHKAGREAQEVDWLTIESPMALAETLIEQSDENSLILVDCLSLWLTNELLAEPSHWSESKSAFLACLPKLKGELVLVSNEVGMGIVPMGEINRRFVDESGWLHQAIAQVAERVVLVTAGIGQILKDVPK